MHNAPYTISIEVTPINGRGIGDVYRLSGIHGTLDAAMRDVAELWTMISDAYTIAVIDASGDVVDVYDSAGWQSETAYDLEAMQ